MPTKQSGEPGRYSRLKAASQTKMSRQHAPAGPPISVKEKKTKKAAPKIKQTHGWAAGRTRRKAIAAGTRNSKKYAKLLKIMRAGYWLTVEFLRRWPFSTMGH